MASFKTVVKRSGEEAKFDGKKIENAVAKAFVATGEVEARDVSTMSRAITLIVDTSLKEAGFVKPTVEQIQDAVELALMKCGYQRTAKAYILYRSQHAKVRETKNTLLDYKTLVNGYIGAEKDWRVKENSTVTMSVGGLILSNSGAITANYWLTEVYDDEIAEAHRKCFIHLHDLSMLTGYCAGWSLKQLIEVGLGGVTGRMTSGPARHLTTLCNQMVNFLGIMQNEWAGAQAFSSFDTYLAPFVKVDNLSYGEVKQCIQSFIYGVNTPSRWGTQAPFTNVTLDWTVPDDMKDMKAIVGGEQTDFTYGECKPEMDMINKAFIETMIEGDANGRGFQYPIPTYSITKDFDWSDTENNRLLFEMTAKYGTPYFSNYINSDMKPSDVRSMCCRLRLDLRELRKKGGGFFGSGESTGSIGVVTLNLPRMAYLSKDKNEFFAMLDRYMDIAARSLSIKRKVVTRFLEEGLYPYTKRYLGAFDNHFSTIGLVGMNEAILNAKWMKGDITSAQGHAFAKETLEHMRERLSDYQELYGDLYNLEATPAESTTYRFARHDVEEFPDIITASTDISAPDKSGEALLKGVDAPYYTNSTHLPVGYTDDIFDALEKEDDLQTLYTSGTVFHGFIGERLPDWRSAATLVRKIAENFKLPYYTMSPTYSVCKTHGYIAGEHFTCPDCGEDAEVYSRITGYYRPVRNWNDGKTAEFHARKTYEPEYASARMEPEVRSRREKKYPVIRVTKSEKNTNRIPALTAAEEAAKPQAKTTADALIDAMQTETIRVDAKLPEQTETPVSVQSFRMPRIIIQNFAAGFEEVSADSEAYESALHEAEYMPVDAMDEPVLITTSTCPNCKIAKKLLDDRGIAYRVLNAEEENGAKMAARYEVKSAPTLLVPNGDDHRVLEGINEIRTYINEPVPV